MDLQGTRYARRDIVRQLRHLQRIRAARARADPREGGISQLGEIRAQGARLERARQHKDYIARLNRIRQSNPALLQTSNLRFAQVDDGEVIGYVKESIAGDNAVAIAVALAKAPPREFWFHFGEIEIGPAGVRRRVKEIENLVTGERHILEWGGARLWLDPSRDPALLFRCLA